MLCHEQPRQPTVQRMTEPHKRPHRHPKYKTASHVHNWHEYDQPLRARGDITVWVRQDAIDTWTPPMQGRRGAPPVYSDVAIETALTLRLLLHLPLRQTEGFLGSVLRLMGLALPCPDHTTLSRRNATVAIPQQVDRISQRLFEKFRPLRVDATSGASWRGKSSPHCSWAIVHSPCSNGVTG